ncbi:alpha/beta fold hydrolase [Amycolatopsis sp. H20-H5]|uniref:alpha/beta fold hydrolase n=1 Tax=Amycolatopsis sp. H20-H5 TaxID=3046309 RepID=UPI002DBA999C|nr:alpha/beta hydrolase [Amycolatopsis sp. H20-H5]MEC3977343.1 alpha/beta hydrolase [Amycolatopsis sp. H20-H5]
MIVFVHGVPETAAIWRKVRALVGGESVALELPGFGCPRPEGFGATKDDYAAWLAGELAKFDEPVDLVGHDWGALLTYRIVATHGELLRSWVADVAGGIHREAVWHAFAKIWQTPGEGEAFFEKQLAAGPEASAGRYEGLGLSPEDALELAAGADPAMASSILDLYRSSTPNVHADWGPVKPSSTPGLVLHASEDPFSGEKRAVATAEQLGARYERLDGVGHFWPYQAPELGVAVMQDFWSSLS